MQNASYVGSADIRTIRVEDITMMVVLVKAKLKTKVAGKTLAFAIYGVSAKFVNGVKVLPA